MNANLSNGRHADDTLSSFVAALPVVIFYNAAREALGWVGTPGLRLSAAR